MIWILAILAVIANALMDECDHKWDRFFGKVIKNDCWMNPRVSWENKKSDNRFWQLIKSTILVMFMDFWHLLKFIFLNCIFGIIILLTGWDWKLIIMFNLAWGVIFELFFTGVFGVLADGQRNKRLS